MIFSPDRIMGSQQSKVKGNKKIIRYHPKVAFSQGQKARGLSKTEYDRSSVPMSNRNDDDVFWDMVALTEGQMSPSEQKAWIKARIKQANKEYSALPRRQAYHYTELPRPVSVSSSKFNSPRGSRGSRGSKSSRK